jgi:hypothetical protein
VSATLDGRSREGCWRAGRRRRERPPQTRGLDEEQQRWAAGVRSRIRRRAITSVGGRSATASATKQSRRGRERRDPMRATTIGMLACFSGGDGTALEPRTTRGHCQPASNAAWARALEAMSSPVAATALWPEESRRRECWIHGKGGVVFGSVLGATGDKESRVVGQFAESLSRRPRVSRASA